MSKFSLLLNNVASNPTSNARVVSGFGLSKVGFLAPIVHVNGLAN